MPVTVTSPVDVSGSAKSANTVRPGASPDGFENSPRKSPPPAPSCPFGGLWLLPSGQGPKRLQEHIRREKEVRAQDTQGEFSQPDPQMFQLETMLLLLILAVLGTPTFSTDGAYYGTPTGTHFCTAIPEGKNLTGVQVYLRRNVIIGIQVKHGDNWGLLYGFSDGTPVQFELNNDEYVNGAYGTCSYYLYQIVLYTTTLRDKILGYFKGPLEFSDYPKNPGQVLKGFCGYYVRGGFRAIQFVWRSPNGTCTE